MLYLVHEADNKVPRKLKIRYLGCPAKMLGSLANPVCLIHPVLISQQSFVSPL